MLLFEHFQHDIFLSVTAFSKVIFRACELNWLHWRSGYRPLWESPCSDQLVSFNLLLSLIIGRDHQVVIWIHVLKGWRFALDGGCFAIHTRDLQHPAGVVFQQIPCECFPSSSHTDHDMFVVQHLKWKESKSVKFWELLQYLESTFCYSIAIIFLSRFHALVFSYLVHSVWVSISFIQAALFFFHAIGSWVYILEPSFTLLHESGSVDNPLLGSMCLEASLWHLTFCYRLVSTPISCLLPHILPTKLFPSETGLTRPQKCLLLAIMNTQIFDTK